MPSSVTTPQQSLVVGLIGNPNTGKTSLFNALTGFHRHIANYPGVTVEIAHGPIRGAPGPATLVDLPGTYSLAAISPDELLVVDFAAGRVADAPAPDVLVVVLDAANLPRNCYLLSQVLELGKPTVVALNMMDIAEQRGLRIRLELLEQRLGIPIVPVVATREATVRPLVEAIFRRAAVARADALVRLPEALARACDEIIARAGDELSRTDALRLLAHRDGQSSAGSGVDVLHTAEHVRAALKSSGIDPAAAEVRARYAWIQGLLEGVIERPLRPVVTWTDRIDRILTHRVGGAAVLLVVLSVVFIAIFQWATPLMDAIDAAIGWIGSRVGPLFPEGVARSLVVDGVIAGVGGVLVFLPQIMILFAFIAVLEDCGYMSRAAYMMDRIMRAAGLSGRAFIPLMSSFACAVPAIMGTRAIADWRERFTTIMIAPFMSCSARLPVYVLLIAAFVPTDTALGPWLQPLVMLCMYLVGVVVAIPVAWLMRKTVFAGGGGGFVLELPSYKWPRLRAIWQRMSFAARGFLVRAGTIILLVNVIVWALAYFPRAEQTRAEVLQAAAAQDWDEPRIESELAGAYLRESYLGRMGHAIEPAIEPIGWDWRIGVAVIASFPAREVIIATLGTIYNLGGEQDETSEPLRHAIHEARWPESGRPVFTLPVALSIMVFFALCAQCASTLVVIGREMRSWLWPVVSFVGMTTVAYLGALLTASLARAAGL